MKNHITSTTIVLLFFLFTISCGLTPVKYNPPPVPLVDLTPDLSLYPKSWKFANKGEIRKYEDEIRKYEDEIENISFSTRFRDKDAITSTYILYRYLSVNEAAERYTKIQQHFVKLYPDLYHRLDLSFTSKYATRTSVQCTNKPTTLLDGLTLCIILAQYDAYVMQLSLPLDPDAMTPTDIVRLLTAVDKKLAVLVTPPQ